MKTFNFRLLILAGCLLSSFSKAQFDRYPRSDFNKNGQPVFIDSLGRQIPAPAFDTPEPFIDGIAVISKGDEENRELALIDRKGKVLVPFNAYYQIANMGKGIAVVSGPNWQQIYKYGKSVYSCTLCEVAMMDDFPGLSVQPQLYTEEAANSDRTIALLDYNGNVIFKRPGNTLWHHSNTVFESNRESHQEPLPYFSISYGVEGAGSYNDLLDLKGRLLIDSLQSFYFRDGQAAIIRNNKAAIIDTLLRPVIPFSAGYSYLTNVNNDPRKTISAGKNGLYGVITLKSDVIFPFRSRYPIVYRTPEEIFEVFDRSGNQWLMNERGDTLSAPEYYMTRPYGGNTVDGPVVLRSSSKTGYRNASGKLILPFAYDYISQPQHDSLLFFRSDTAGFMNTSGKRLFTFPVPCYGASWFAEGKAFCVLGEKTKGKKQKAVTGIAPPVKYAWVNADGKIINGDAYTSFSGYTKGMALASNNEGYFFVDKDLKKVRALGKYDYYSYFENGLAVIGDGRKFGLIDITGRIVLPVSYEGLDTRASQQDYSAQGSGISYYDATGQQLFSPGNMQVPDINEGRITAREDGNRSFIDVIAARDNPGSPVIVVSDSLNQWYVPNPGLTDFGPTRHAPLDGNEALMIPVYAEGYYGFVQKKTGKEIIAPQLEAVQSVGREGAIVLAGGSYGLMDTLGKMLFHGYASVRMEGDLYHAMNIGDFATSLPLGHQQCLQNVYYNKAGKKIFEINAHDQVSFLEGDSLAYFRFGRAYSIVGKSGKIYKTTRLNVESQFIGICHNRLIYKAYNKGSINYTAYDLKNKKLFSLDLNQVIAAGPYQLSKNLFGFYGENGMRYFCDAKGHVVPYGLETRPEEYESWGSYFLKEEFVVQNFESKKYGIINRSGAELFPFRYTFLAPFVNGHALHTDSAGNISIINRQGKTLLNYINGDYLEMGMMYGAAPVFSEGWFRDAIRCRPLAEQDPEMMGEEPFCFRFIDTNGVTVLSLSSTYKLAGNFSEGLAPVINDAAKLGYIDKTGNEIIPCRYNLGNREGEIMLPPFRGGFAWLPGMHGYIDRNGKEYFSGEPEGE